MVKKRLVLLVVMLLLNTPFSGVFAFQDAERNVVVYNNAAYVVETHSIDIRKGVHEYTLKGLPEQIIENSIFVETVDDDVDFFRQEYDRNTYDYFRILRENAGKMITVFLDANASVHGLLVSAEGSEIIMRERDVVTVIPQHQIKGYSVEGLKIDPKFKPVLRVVLSGRKDGKAKIRLHYLTNGIFWNAQYTGYFDQSRKKLDFRSSAYIANNLNVDLHAKSLVLVAGEINRGQQPGRRIMADMAFAKQEVGAAAPAQPGFSQGEAFIYHKYVLNQELNLDTRTNQQMRLFEDRRIDIKEKYIFDNSRYGNSINTFISFKNDKRSGFGAPLPAGLCQVYQKNESGSVYLGEDRIANTALDREVSVRIGSAFDLNAERVMKNYVRLDNRRRDETYEITLNNASEDNKVIEVVEHFGGQWKIIESTHEYNKKDAQSAKFMISVKPGGQEVLTFTVRYN